MSIIPQERMTQAPDSKTANSMVPKGWTPPWMGPTLSNQAGRIASEEQAGGTAIDQYQQYGQKAALGNLLDPSAIFNKWQGMYQSDPMMRTGQMGYDTSMWDMNRASQGFQDYAGKYLNKTMPQLYNQAMGNGPSYAEKYGAAQRQQAQGDIARQAAMNARGGMSAADRRSAIMQSSGVGANMAAQIAAARVQERQQAMQQYLQAAQQQANVRGMGLEAAGSTAGKWGDYYKTGQAGFGGVASTAQGQIGQQANAFYPGDDEG